MFKNVMVYRIGEGFAPTLADVQAALEPMQFVECGASQEKSIGWIPPRGEAHGPLVESVAGQWIMKLMIESKAVPGNVVRRKADERIAEIEAATGRKPGKKEKRDLMDEVLLSLLPQAFARQSSVLVWMDLDKRRLVLNAGSQGKADEVMSALMNVMGGLSVSLIQTVTSPQAAMTQWLLAPTPDEWPADLTVERETVLKSTGEDAASVRFTRHHLANDDVRKHVLEGKLPTQLALSWDGRVAFVLTETLQLKKVQYLDGVMDESGTDKNEDRFDADVALSTGLLAPLIDSLIEALGGEMELGAAGADAPTENPVPKTVISTVLAGGADDGDPPF
ncbi:recombination-associated protein RdgC [Limnohabitans sp. Rim47]|uniref:recombination-associated protein RdgC n=1 Tax=Limnohabitans sp. Rim47 TaxID=1100721 RepID=UPI000303BA0D|nr:recombination-associated protein RdgC [Limnohabitans sp. Rim47]